MTSFASLVDNEDREEGGPQQRTTVGGSSGRRPATRLPGRNGDDDTVSPLHVLIPCHVSSPRRITTFLRCAKSIVYQVGNPHTSVLVGLSGPKECRDLICSALEKISENSPESIVWYLKDDELEARPQMEHIRHLLADSRRLNPDALLSFVDNDDMCHPTRFGAMYNSYQNAPLPVNGVFCLPCKLLLDESMTPEEGEYEKYVDLESRCDFNHWKKFSELRKKVRLATNTTANDLDAEEYFDYLVPSVVLQAFFDMTPVAVSSHRFCDLRLYTMLRYHDQLQAVDQGDTWLLAHYKISLDEKYRIFDNHGSAGMGGQAGDQISLSTEVTSADRRLARRFRDRLSSHQVAMCRGHVESVILSITWGRDHFELEEAKQEKVAELSQRYGRGFGDALWQECSQQIHSLFDSGSLTRAERTWKTLIQQ